MPNQKSTKKSTSNMAKNLANSTKIIGLVGDGIDVVQKLDNLAVIKDFIEFIRTIETEKTKRIAIQSRRDELVTAIQAEQKIIEQVIAAKFAERKATLDELYKLLRDGANDKNAQLIDKALDGIIKILQENVLQDIESFSLWYDDPNRPNIEF